MPLPGFIRCAALILVLLGVGFLRTLGPVPGLLPVWNHPLGLALLLLFVVWLACRSDGRRSWVIPLIAGLMLEGWIRVAFLSPAFERWVAPRIPDPLADSLYVLLGGLWFLGLAAAFAPAVRVHLRAKLSLRNWRNGFYMHTLSILLVYGLLAMLLQTVEGLQGMRLQVPIYAATTLWMLAGQISLCAGEEIFYRGFLMGAFEAAGRQPGAAWRPPGSLGLWLSGLFFALDHVRGMAWGPSFVMTALYSFGLALLLGLMVRLTGSLALSILAHLFHNLMLLKLGLWVSDAGGFVDFQAQTYISIYFIVAFSLLFLIRRPTWEPLRRAVARAS
ncbi:MAG: CPBP family intramembrane glutamic endopeptidase [Acidobacteriota bacterium]